MDVNLKVHDVVCMFGPYIKFMVAIKECELQPDANAFTILMSSQSLKPPAYPSYVEVRNFMPYNGVIDLL